MMLRFVVLSHLPPPLPPRSHFWETLRVLYYVKPLYYLLHRVKPIPNQMAMTVTSCTLQAALGLSLRSLALLCISLPLPLSLALFPLLEE